MFLTDSDTAEVIAFRRKLHERPELSGEERDTARAVRAFLERTRPDRVIGNLGGHGLAAIYEGAAPGPCLMFRAELDALPIDEVSAAPHRSKTLGKAHLCGHDGHMASLAALALGFSRARPKRGRVVLLFQPAEETGVGAEAVIVDPMFVAIEPDFAFAWHNMPGMPLAEAAVAVGPIACASRGLRADLQRQDRARLGAGGRRLADARAGAADAGTDRARSRRGDRRRLQPGHDHPCRDGRAFLRTSRRAGASCGRPCAR